MIHFKMPYPDQQIVDNLAHRHQVLQDHCGLLGFYRGLDVGHCWGVITSGGARLRSLASQKSNEIPIESSENNHTNKSAMSEQAFTRHTISY